MEDSNAVYYVDNIAANDGIDLYIDEGGIACAATTPVKFWEYPRAKPLESTCSHKIQYSYDQSIVADCKTKDESTCTAGATKCDWLPRVNNCF